MCIIIEKVVFNKMSQQHHVNEFTEGAIKNLRSLVDVNTIIGDPISTADGTVIIPVSKVSFGYGSGGGSDLLNEKSDVFAGATGGGVTIQPIAFLVVANGKVELLQIQTANNTGDRIVNAIPGLVDKVGEIIKKDKPKDAGAKVHVEED